MCNITWNTTTYFPAYTQLNKAYYKNELSITYNIIMHKISTLLL